MLIIAEGVEFELEDYFPQIENTKNQTSGTFGKTAGQTTETSKCDTVDFSLTKTNSYRVSICAGFHGKIATGEVTGTYNYSDTQMKEHFYSLSSEFLRNLRREISLSESMSIKDWSTYSLINPYTKSPFLTFCLEFP